MWVRRRRNASHHTAIGWKASVGSKWCGQYGLQTNAHLRRYYVSDHLLTFAVSCGCNSVIWYIVFGVIGMAWLLWIIWFHLWQLACDSIWFTERTGLCDEFYRLHLLERKLTHVGLRGITACRSCDIINADYSPSVKCVWSD